MTELVRDEKIILVGSPSDLNLQCGPLRRTGVRINFGKHSLHKINSFLSTKNLTLAEFFGGDKNVLTERILN